MSKKIDVSKRNYDILFGSWVDENGNLKEPSKETPDYEGLLDSLKKFYPESEIKNMKKAFGYDKKK